MSSRRALNALQLSFRLSLAAVAINLVLTTLFAENGWLGGLLELGAPDTWSRSRRRARMSLRPASASASPPNRY